LGPVQSLTGMSRITFPNRLITSEPHNGTVVDVDVPTNIAGIMAVTPSIRKRRNMKPNRISRCDWSGSAKTKTLTGTANC